MAGFAATDIVVLATYASFYAYPLICCDEHRSFLRMCSAFAYLAGFAATNNEILVTRAVFNADMTRFAAT